jgi:hypothetical protein
MIGADSAARAGAVHVFITDEGTHSAEHWAIVTAQMLVSAGPNISPGRLEALGRLRGKLVGTLTEAFQSVKPTSSLDEIASTAHAATQRFADHAKGSPWEVEFGHETIAAMMEDVVRRNLATHADIGLRTE